MAVADPTSFEGRGAFAIWSELFKARLSALVLLTTAVGFHLGSRDPMDYRLLVETLLGTSLLAAGAAALNQYLEREHDARMPRTAHRPLPTGEVQPRTVLVVGVMMSMAGMLVLTACVNPLSGLLGMITLASYLFVYTPLKRITVLNTLVGAVPGALPPLIGWAAATGRLSAGGWALFTLLFFWQLPHFMAIAWLYREDYAKGGFRMLPTVDPDGRRTGATAVRHTLLLLAFSLAPFLMGVSGKFYLATALVLGICFLAAAVSFSMRLRARDARILFFASILYLPLVLGVLVADKLPRAEFGDNDFGRNPGGQSIAQAARGIDAGAPVPRLKTSL
ncbi:MAG: protoheme IX farnesyltransferase [Verrucomicrobia bacterium]|nr:MAG: protoheme IX farnesyltransferase [Verrucomicrobiota bacterium]